MKLSKAFCKGIKAGSKVKQRITGRRKHEMRKVSWDELFMTMVYLIAMKSKDKYTHCGAIIVGSNNEVRAVGYNGYVRGINDDIEERQERPEKYFWFEHAERNAIYNTILTGTPLQNCRLYTNGVPCMDCARAIVQTGIKEVIVDQWWDDNNGDKWKEHAERTIQLFRESGVSIRYYSGKTLDVQPYRRGKVLRRGSKKEG